MESTLAPTTLNVRRIVLSGILAAIAILLGITRLGFIPMPTGINATIMHVPAIIGGIMEGWLVGGLVGTIFGLFSFLNATTPLFKDPLVAILPRIFIGVTAYYAYAALKNRNDYLALAVSAAIGTLTNTVLVLSMATIRGYLPVETSLTVGLTHGIPEIIVAIIIVLAVVAAWKRMETGRGRSSL